MKVIYRRNSQNYFSSSDVVDDDYQLQANETTTAVPRGAKTPVKWLGSSWQEATDEEHEVYEKSHDPSYGTPVLPSAEQQMLNTMGQQLAKANQDNTELKGMVNMLGQQVAKLQMGGTK